jgi:fatty-acyl-CoA synthase
LAELESIRKDVEVHIITPEMVKDAASKPGFPEIGEDDIAFLQHSSGTTGLKKGVALSHKSVLNQIESYSENLKLDSKDVIVSWLPLYHDMGLIACFILPMLKRIPVVMMDPFDWVRNPKMLFEQIEKNKGTLVWLPNFAFNFCAQMITEKHELSSMKAFINCSESCKPHTFRIFYDAFKGWGLKKHSMQTCYAMAETVFAVTQSKLQEDVKEMAIDKEQFAAHQKAVTRKGGLEFLSVGTPI